MSPAWIPCPDCDDFFCTIHQEHVYDCACPELEAWIDRGVDPYEAGGPGDGGASAPPSAE